jgi:hypothetical protein
MYTEICEVKCNGPVSNHSLVLLEERTNLIHSESNCFVMLFSYIIRVSGYFKNLHHSLKFFPVFVNGHVEFIVEFYNRMNEMLTV